MRGSAIFEKCNWQKVRNVRAGDGYNYLGNRMETRSRKWGAKKEQGGSCIQMRRSDPCVLP